jgi:hypothetical protein
MAGGLLYRWFGVGRMPAAIAYEIAGEAVLYRTEGIRVSVHRSGRVPGDVEKAGVSVGWGSFAVTDRRVIGSRGRGKLADVRYDAADPAGPATFILDPTGLHVLFDLDRVHPSTHGSMRVDFRQPFTEADLARFPVRRLSFPVDPQKVVRLFGSLKRLPTG